MSIVPGSSRVVTIGGSAAAPNSPNGKLFGTTKTVKSFTLNPASPLEAGRSLTGAGELDRATAASTIAGNTTAT
jgi:hypothetical protein